MISSLLLTAVAAGCGGSSAGTASSYWDQLLQASCSYGVRCGVYENLDSCKATLGTIRRSLGQLIASEDAAVASGSLSYDADAAATCLDMRQNRACDDALSRAASVCDHVFVGTRRTGEACAFPTECVSDVCNVPSCSMACCAGTCGDAPTLVAIGQSCAAGPCVDGAYCDASETCSALLPAGAACTSILDCQVDLICGDSSHTCLKPAARGQACNPADSSLLACAVGACDAVSKTCVPYVFAGAACDPNNNLCGFALSCDPASSKCTAGPALGESCSSRCAADGYCKWDSTTGTGICVPLGAKGDSCTTDAACETGTCDPAAHACADPSACS